MNSKNAVLLVLAAGLAAAQGEIIGFDLSPAGFDNAAGLSPLNETSAVISSGSGNEIGSGVLFDTDTRTLSLSIGYGSFFGFTDLTGPAGAAHLHGPAGTNASASVLIDLAGLHLTATNPAAGGSIVGTVVLTTNQANDLLSGLIYVNVHTATYPGGEIRAQLIPANTLPLVQCPVPVVIECTGGDGTLVNLQAQVSDADGDPVTVVWTANGSAMQTNSVAAGTTNAAAISFSGLYQLGTNVVNVSATDGFDVPTACSTTVAVVDTTPPTIVSAVASTNILWPPNHKMRPVQFSVVATDICGTVTTRIKSISSNQGVVAKGSGKKSPDWNVTGKMTANLRAERSGKNKNGRDYVVTIEAIDNSGNSATTNLVVHVPHDMRKGSTNAPASNPPSNSNTGGKGNGKGKGKK